ncbi:MAG: DNA-binding protein WhiA [Clostridiales bacterium]|nr:DNA-binding protein WhiA [Clostridiales bacterium]
MSFSYKVKCELCKAPVQRLCCARAEAYGVLLYCNIFTPHEIRIITENPEFAARLPRIFQRAFGIRFDRQPENLEQKGKLIFQILSPDKLTHIINAFGYDPRQSLVVHINFGLLEDECCRISFLRGAFLSGGSVTDPEKRYHLEMGTSHFQASRELAALLTDMGFTPKDVMRKGYSVTYFKQSEHIEDFLTKIGAPVAAMDVMTAKVDKEIRNGANRALNCDMANVNKTLSASQEQTEAIAAIKKHGLWDKLPEKLAETAKLRMDNPELSLAQLAEMTAVSKSCMNHRMRKLMEMARNLS